jgi:hypothetical protein
MTTGERKQVGDWSWNTEVFWSKIVKTDDASCWAWTGSVGPHTNLFGGQKAGKPQMTQARRILYREVYEEDCEDLQIKHKCGNAYCMNWHHFDVKPNLRKFYIDGSDRGTKPPPEPKNTTEGLRQAKLVPVKQLKWWQI